MDFKNIYPMQLLGVISKQNPRIWSEIDTLRKDTMERGDQKLWPTTIYFPLNWSFNYLNPDTLVVEPWEYPAPDERLSKGQDVACAYVWRLTKSIFVFDEDIANCIFKTPINPTESLPIELFFRLPQWCLWIEKTNDTPGFFVCLDWINGISYLHIQDENREFTIDLPLIQGVSIQSTFDEIEKMITGAKTTLREQMDSAVCPDPKVEKSRRAGNTITGRKLHSIMLSKMLGLVLYLCSEEPDLYDISTKQKYPVKPLSNPKKGRIMPAVAPTIWHTCFKLGDQLRTAINSYGTGSGTGKIPHIRSAHWHKYWVGPKDTQRLTIKWLLPIAVNMDFGSEDPTTIHKVTNL